MDTGERHRILVVDDNRDSCDSLVRAFRVWGHQSWGEYEGHAAIERAVAEVPTIVLLDIGMPGMDGWEIAQRMRSHPTLDDTLIYAMTGYSDPADVQRSMEAGMNYHFVKPLMLDDLWRRVKDQRRSVRN